MDRKWITKELNHYFLDVDGKNVGEMQISPSSTAHIANCKLGEFEFTIRRTGFWKSNIEILDSNKRTFGKVYNEKWYANSSILEFKNKKYKIILRNNPLAEYVIFDKDKDLLAYGIKTDQKGIVIQITAEEESDLVLDFLMWYLFAPIVIETTGDNFIFHLLLTSQ